jgi:transcriptional regulator with GAF, ATPase, and Fis domain
MSDGETLLPCHLPSEMAASPDVEVAPAEDARTLAGQERTLILKALEENDWNQSRAAQALGITRYHVRHRMKKYNIRKPSRPER